MFVKSGDREYEDLINDLYFNKWFDVDEEYKYFYDVKDIKLIWVDYEEIFNCEYGKLSCECCVDVDCCIFNFEIDEF